MKLILTRRVISKKNSKQWIMRGRRRFLVPSVAYERYLAEATIELKPQLKEKFADQPVRVHCDFFIQGKYRVDGDNLFTSILDTLQYIGAINDDQNVMAGSWEKYPGVAAFGTHIYIEPHGGKYERIRTI
ncbi:MAG: RusA family crossover junction endodeoxyribonuclease [Bacteroidales bacterium]|jgi:Holliday junction resolvase RusA-like endonuclease